MTSTRARLGSRQPRRRPPARPHNGKPVLRRWDWTQVPILLTALAAVGALFFNTLQTSEALRATRDQIALSEQSQLTDRFTKAVEQLGTRDSTLGTRTEVRLGGIYALERIARDSARDHPTVMEVLSAYVRMHVPIARCQSSGPRATDVQAILTVIGRRDTRRDRDRLALNNTCLVGYNLSGANLTNTDLTGADLTNTDLTGANLSGANLTEANLSFADFTRARASSHGREPQTDQPCTN